jgi:hypothetical protein
VIDSTIFTTFQIAFDKFPNEIIDKLGDAIIRAAGIPIFAAQSIYLSAAGSLLKLASNLGHIFLDGKNVYSFSHEVELTHPGVPPASAGWRVLTQETETDDFLQNLQVGTDGRLMEEEGSPYRGQYPYIVISLDGRKNDSYKEFTRTAISAVLLDKFFGVQEGQTVAMDKVLEGLKLYSDYHFRNEAEIVQKELNEMTPTDPEYTAKQTRLKALKDNILDPIMK